MLQLRACNVPYWVKGFPQHFAPHRMNAITNGTLNSVLHQNYFSLLVDTANNIANNNLEKMSSCMLVCSHEECSASGMAFIA